MSEIKLLLVDDEVEFVETLSERLKLRGLDSRTMLNGEEALTLLDPASAQEEAVPDVMVLDLLMPGIDGFAVMRRVQESYPEVKVVVLTGHGNDATRQRCREAGAYAYLEKPVNIDELIEAVREAHASPPGATRIENQNTVDA